MEKLLKQLLVDYPGLTFTESDKFCWSPKKNQVLYERQLKPSRTAPWSLLHEVGHALLAHSGYESDIELIGLESDAWQKAKEIGKKYGFEIDEDHIQDCMDTYRDWLHQRSACPTCDNRSIQQDNRHYKCFNCGQMWSVSSSRFCRPYRRLKPSNTKSEPRNTKQTANFK